MLNSLEQLRDEIKSLVKATEFSEALEKLAIYYDKLGYSDKDVTQLQQRVYKLNRKYRAGTIDEQQHTIECNKISVSILECIEPNYIPSFQTLKENSKYEKKQYMTDLIWNDFFPNTENIEVPFGYMLDNLFFSSNKDARYPIHGPNVIRFTDALLNFSNSNTEAGLFVEGQIEDAKYVYNQYRQQIEDALFENNFPNNNTNNLKKHTTKVKTTKDLLILAALYHDIGKYIKNHKHPEIGANILKYYNPDASKQLLNLLSHDDDMQQIEKKQHRYMLLTSIVKHHDKYGVVSTGEGSLPLLSDILYFDSSPKNQTGILKNVTAVMLLNLADIAAVNKSIDDDRTKVKEYIDAISNNRKKENQNPQDTQDLIVKIINIIKKPSSCLGLSPRKLEIILNDWETLIGIIKTANFNKARVKDALLEEAKMPFRTIERVFRLITESIETAEAKCLISEEYITKSVVENILIIKLGTYQFQSFCDSFALVIKLDYGLKFFKSLVCALIRKNIYDEKIIEQKHSEAFTWVKEQNKPHASEELLLHEQKSLLEYSKKEDLTYEIADVIIKVLDVIISRYTGVFTFNTSSPRRYGLQMGELTKDVEIWKRIVSQLCIDKNKEHFAFSWIIDEITIWSFD